MCATKIRDVGEVKAYGDTCKEMKNNRIFRKKLKDSYDRHREVKVLGKVVLL